MTNRERLVWFLTTCKQVGTVLAYVGIVLLGMHLAFSVCGR